MTPKDPPKKSIGSAGGKARDANLSSDRKREIAQTGALARWGAPATHRGNFAEAFGIDVDCYVLDDLGKTAVISQRGMAAAIGLSARGNAFPRFLTSRAMVKTLGAEVLEKLAKPLKFQWRSPGAQQPPGAIYGYDVALLIDVCKAILTADTNGDLAENQKAIAAQARIILNASAKAGIKGLVYALAGYNPTAEEIIQAFKAYIQEEARKYEKEFPNELYEQWYRLYQIPPLSKGKPWHFKHLTVNHIYYPLARSNGKILELVRALKAQHGIRQTKLFQFLNEVGARALRIQIGRVLEMSESSEHKAEYEGKIAKRFGGQVELELVLPPAPGTMDAH